MEPRHRPSFSVQLSHRRIALVVVTLVGVAFGAGCHHRRNVMRPVFGRPAIIETTPPCATGDCGGAVMTAPAENGFSEPARLTPEHVPLDDSQGGPASPPANGGGSGTLGNEPVLEPTTPGVQQGGVDEGISSESRMRPPLEPPTNTSGRSTLRSQPMSRRAVLRREVQAYVNDPADLFTPPRADRPWRYIVLHHSAHPSGSFAQIDRDHRERLGTAGCGYHFVVGNGTGSPDGQVEVATRWSEQKGGQHCRDSRLPDINEYGIGVCLIGNFDDAQPTERQIAGTRAIVAYLQDRYGIPDSNVVMHDHAAQTATTCPGKRFPAESIMGASDRGMAQR